MFLHLKVYLTQVEELILFLLFNVIRQENYATRPKTTGRSKKEKLRSI